MSFITDLIKEKAGDILGNVSLPDNLKEQVVGGVSDSIFGSIKETATKEGGIDQLIELFTGRQEVASSPVTNLASSLFGTEITSKLGLSPAIVKAVLPLIPKIIEQFTSSKKIDINDLISEVTSSGMADKLKDAAGSILGGFFK